MAGGAERERARRGREESGGRTGTKQRRREKVNRREAPWKRGRGKKIPARYSRGRAEQ